MRIAIYENLPPGGAKRASFEFGRYLTARHEVDLYRLSITNNRAFDLGPLVRQVHTYPFRPLFGLLDRRLLGGHYAPRSHTLFAPLRRLHRRIAKDIAAGSYDIVLAHTDAMTQSPYLLRWLPRGRGIYFCQEPLRVVREAEVLAAHRRKLAAGRLGALRLIEDRYVLARLKRADRLNVSHASRVLVNSEYSRRQVESAYQREASVCYLGVDPQVFAPPGDASRVNEVLCVGSPLLAKGNPLIIEALASISESIRPRLRVVAGSMEGAETVRARATALGVDLVMESAIDDAALARHYQRSLATIGASRMEPFGLTVLESMACGTPVIAVREGGYVETVLDGESGLLVDPTPRSMGAAIAQLASKPDDVARFGRRGRALVLEKWTWEQAGARLEKDLEVASKA